MIITANTIITFMINHVTVSYPKSWIGKKTIMPVHTKIKSIYLLKAAVTVNFRIFQILDFPKTLKKHSWNNDKFWLIISSTLYLEKLVIIYSIVNILIFYTHSLLSFFFSILMITHKVKLNLKDIQQSSDYNIVYN